MERGLLDRARALAILDLATNRRCGFVEAARALGAAPDALAALAALAAPQATPASGRLPRIGARVGGYDLERVLGQGGMGAVYVGRNEAGAVRAIKVPLFEGEDGDEQKARFELEARALAKIPPHPNVIRVHGAGSDGPIAYCVLELIEGESLHALLKKGPLPLDRALDLAEQLARALAHVHQAGVIHRDVKPENVIVRSADGTAVLMDFGLARDLAERQRLTRTGTVMGTPAYMAPEQVNASATVDARADVWAAGAVLYELVSGQRAFKGETQPALLKNILIDDPPPLASTRAEVPRDLDTVVQRALAKERLRRYPGAAELADEIARVRRGEAIHARRPGAAEQLARRIRRVPLWVRAVIVLALAGACGVALDAYRKKGAASEALTRTVEEKIAKLESESRALRGELLLSDATPNAEKLSTVISELDGLTEGSTSIDADVHRKAAGALALARVELLLARKDARFQTDLPAARGAEDLDRKFLEAVATLRAGRAADARVAFDRLLKELQNTKRNDLKALAMLGYARVELDRNQPSSAAEFLAALAAWRLAPPELERAIDRVNQQAAGMTLARNTQLSLEEQKKQLQRLRNAFGETAWRKVARGLILERSQQKDSQPTRECANAWLLFKDDREVFAGSRELATVARAWIDACMRSEENALAALRAWELLHVADPSVPLPDELPIFLGEAAIHLVHADKNPTARDDWRELALGLTRMGWDIEMSNHVLPFLLGEDRRVIETLRRDASAKDWASAVLLAEAIRHNGAFSRHAPPGIRDDSEVPQQLKQVVWEEVGLLAEQGVQARDAEPSARALANFVKGDALVLFLRSLTPKSAEAKATSARARAALEAALEGTAHRKPDAALDALALAHVWAGDPTTAEPLARRAAEAADDRTRRTQGATNAEKAALLAKGRPPGGVLQPYTLGVTDSCYLCRRDLIYALVLLDKLDRGLEVARSFRDAGIGRVDAWRMLEALVLYARGAPGDDEAASKLIDEDVAASLNMSRIDSAVALSLLARLLDTEGKTARSEAARAKRAALMGVK